MKKTLHPPKILITGAYGLVGGLVYRHLQPLPGQYELYALDKSRSPSLRTPPGWNIDIPQERFRCADITDFSAVLAAVQGMEVVVHMAGAADPEAGWEAIHACNVVGAYNVFEACRQAGVSRVIYASSLKVSHGYKDEEPYKAIMEGRFAAVPPTFPLVTHAMPYRPVDPYSVSKIWGEGLASMYSATHGLSCLCLRFGWVNAADSPMNSENLTLWSSQQDMLRCVVCAINAPGSVRFDTFFSVSHSRYRWVDIEHARIVIGYEPQDWAEEFLDHVLK